MSENNESIMHINQGEFVRLSVFDDYMHISDEKIAYIIRDILETLFGFENILIFDFDVFMGATSYFVIKEYPDVVKVYKEELDIKSIKLSIESMDKMLEDDYRKADAIVIVGYCKLLKHYRLGVPAFNRFKETIRHSKNRYFDVTLSTKNKIDSAYEYDKTIELHSSMKSNSGLPFGFDNEKIRKRNGLLGFYVGSYYENGLFQYSLCMELIHLIYEHYRNAGYKRYYLQKFIRTSPHTLSKKIFVQDFNKYRGYAKIFDMSAEETNYYALKQIEKDIGIDEYTIKE